MDEEAFRYFDAKLDTWRQQVMREADSRIDRAEKAAAEKVESIRRSMKQVAAVAGLVTIGGILTILQSIHTQAEQAGLGRVRAAAVEAERHRDAAGGIIETLRATSEQRANDAGLALIGTLRQEAERRLAAIRQFQEEAFAPDRGVIVDHGVIRVGGPNLEIALREPRTRTHQVTVNFSTPVRLSENVCILLTELSNVSLCPYPAVKLEGSSTWRSAP